MSLLMSIDLKNAVVRRYECNPERVRNRVVLAGKALMVEPGEKLPPFGDAEALGMLEKYRATGVVD